MNKYYLIILLILAGCSSPSSRRDTTTINPTAFLPTVVTPTAIITIAPTLTPTSTTIPSHPISTPLAKKDPDITLELLRTNNGCDLPCWWGIIPNQTSWYDAKTFLKSFSTIYENQPLPPSDWFFPESFSSLNKDFSEVDAVRTIMSVQEGVIKEIKAEYFDEESYHVQEFLSRVGKPTDILLLTYSSDYGMPLGKVPFLMALYCPEKGIMATYAADADVENSIIDVCIKTSPVLFLWSPSEAERSIDYILGWDKQHEKYLTLDIATELSITEFYETYSKPNSSICLQTPTSLWPSQ